MKAEINVNERSWMNGMAKAGLISKGIVYLILGILAFMSAFEIGGQLDANANRKGVFSFIKEAPGGVWLLVLLSIGLVCYSLWRGIQAFAIRKKLKWTKRFQYLFSCLAYLSVAVTAIQVILHTYNKDGDSNSLLAAQVMKLKYGQWLVGAAALLVAGIGLYQVWYGLSEKYKKHIQQRLYHGYNSILLYAGKIGYVARGVVWLVIAYLLLKAALHANAAEAGDSGKAFHFIENTHFGSYLLGIVGFGLIAYGVFNFIRARYESFQERRD